MQHLDEGTIHAWLDGALSPDEAAKAEAHVAECPQCASAVAEARGFIAASSRILTALDNAPRGVIPAAAPRKRIDPLVWRVAATVLVVAAGTLVVVRNRGANEYPAAASVSAGGDTSAQPLPSVAEQVPPSVTEKGAPSSAPQIAFSGKAIAPSARAQIARENKATGTGVTVPTAQNAPESEIAAMSAQNALSMKGVASGVAMDAAFGQEPLKVVATPRRLGARVTLYEVAPGDTVTLMESVPMQLSEVVVTGAAAPVSAGAAGKSAAVQLKERAAARVTATASDSQRVAGAPPSAPRTLATTQAPQAQMANAEHTITWIDSATGSTVTLSGRMPEARLQEIRVRIERERAAARKKP